MKKILLTLLLIQSIASLAAQDGKLRVLTSFLPLQAHAQAIAGDSAHVEQLLTKDAGPHDFQLTPGDVKRVAEADLLIINGAGLEAWLDELVKQAGKKELVVVDCSRDLPKLENPKALDTAPEPGVNPHFWLDPVLAQEQAKTILAALKKAAPQHADQFQKRADVYLAELVKLDAAYRDLLEPLPNKRLVTLHDAFPYLAARYGLDYLGFLAKFPEKDPAPRDTAALLDQIREQKVGVVFGEAGYNGEILRDIAKQGGAKFSELDTLEVGQGSPEAYLQRMRANLAALRAAFQ